jgi:hypothetical protein
MRRLHVPVLCGLGLLGCNLNYRVEHLATPEIDPTLPHPDLATICVLRPQSFGHLASFEHYDNDHLVAVSEGKKVYFCYLARPGTHNLVASSDNDARLGLWANAGSRYFVRLHVNMGPDLLTPMNTDEAMAMLQELRYIRTVRATSRAAPLMRAPVPAASRAPTGRAEAGLR